MAAKKLIREIPINRHNENKTQPNSKGPPQNLIKPSPNIIVT